jgi:hypothetical protein
MAAELRSCLAKLQIAPAGDLPSVNLQLAERQQGQNKSNNKAWRFFGMRTLNPGA